MILLPTKTVAGVIVGSYGIVGFGLSSMSNLCHLECQRSGIGYRNPARGMPSSLSLQLFMQISHNV